MRSITALLARGPPALPGVYDGVNVRLAAAAGFEVLFLSGFALSASRLGEPVRLGAAGCLLEAQVWPKRCGHMEGKRVVDVDAYLRKLRGAPFHVTARPGARAVLGLDEAIRRERAFAEAGFRLVVLPVTGLLAAAHGLRTAYETMRRDGASREVADRMLRFDAMNALFGPDARHRRERDWSA